MDGGIGEAALMSTILEGAGTGALVGGGVSLLTGQDPLKGALLGGLTGGVFSGAMGAFGGAEEAVNPIVAENAPEFMAPETITNAQNIANVSGNTGMQNVAFNEGFSPEMMTGNMQNAVYTPGAEGGDFIQAGGRAGAPGQSPFVGDSNFVRTPGGGYSDMTSDIQAATSGNQGITAAPGAQNAPASTQDFAKQLGVTSEDVNKFLSWDKNVEKLLAIPHTCTDAELMVHALAAQAIILIYRNK